ncbi:HAD-IIIC family phosphatase [Blastococcus sp. SYSU D00922]
MSSRAPEPLLERLHWQPVVLGAAPRRLDLLALTPSWPTRQVHLRVHRNTTFEHVASLLPAFLAYSGLSASFNYSDYDDSLNGVGAADATADVEVVWLDYQRYGDVRPAVLADWLRGRLEALRARTSAPVLVVDRPGDGPAAATFNDLLERVTDQVPGCWVADLSEIARRVGDSFLDLRTRDVAGTAMSARAAVLAAQRMGLRWLPALVSPPVKALAVDLDMTLYDGVLGEDGPAGVRLTPAHEALQRMLLDLKDDGLLLALVSRNEPADVAALFSAREDFPLRLEDFTATAIGWGAKSRAVAAVAADLRIAPDAVVFVDDNPGELAEVAAGTAVAGLVHASDPAVTATALSLFPGVHGHRRTTEDALRAADLAAAARREAIAQADPSDYLRSLGVRVELAVDRAEHLPRMAELTVRTNQFNAALRRTGPAELARWVAADDVRVVTAALADRLSDSGLVALVAGHRSPDGDVVVDELCISCRALGRGIEDHLLAAAVGRLLEDLGGTRALVAYEPGPRNGPARAWLAAHSAAPLDSPALVPLDRDAAGCAALLADAPITVTWKEPA